MGEGKMIDDSVEMWRKLNREEQENYYYYYYCGDKGPSWYTRPWSLFSDVDTFEEKQMIGKAPEWRIT